MKKLDNLNFDNWSKKAISNPLMQGNSIDFIFPVKFEKYCKIFHPFFLSPEYKTMKGEGWNMDANRVIENLEGKDDEHSYAIEHYEPKPIFLLAELFDLKYDKNFKTDILTSTWKHGQPKWLLCPDEGTLDESILPEIENILSKHTAIQDCYYHYVMYAIDTYQETIYQGLLKELPATIDIGLMGTPNTVWPESKEWYLYSNYDADYTLLGGTKKLIDEILISENIEALEWNEKDIFYPEK